SSLLTTLGLRALAPSSPTPPNLSATFLISHFLFAYIFLSARGVKRHFKLDHNLAPREDVAKYGEAMVREGKLSRKQLDLVKRWEAAHANAVEDTASLWGVCCITMMVLAGKRL
ncbi:hypothetical protein LSUE1_G008483, partial [Lachnellula suecica]